MFLSRVTASIKRRQVELRYGAAGFALGLGGSVAGVLLDMQVRAWRGVDGTFVATFSSTLLHGLGLLTPLVLGRIFLSIGKRRAALQNRLKQMSDTEVHLREQAHHDILTGLYNRSHLTAALEEGIATRNWAARGGLLYMLDLDDFKNINDTFGHRAGDLVLIEVAKRLKATQGPDDIAVRLGGDEFIVVHFPGDDEGFPELFAERLVAEVCREIRIDDAQITPSTSVGVAKVGIDGSTWSDVIRSADIALYQSKLDSAKSYCIFRPEMRVECDRLSALESDMRLGIDRGEFELHYQPIFGTETGTIRSFEALVRWNHPTKGLIAPLDFIPLAESSGLIVKLGRQILTEACRMAATWPKPIGIGVNLSPVQFKDTHLVDHVEAALRESGLAPGRLDLEITESLLLESSPRVRQAMDRLRSLGVRITMDDFGTGFSSLSNLRSFRFDRLKIDRCFTKDVAANADDAEIVRTIVRLSRTLRMETILEGVETEGQLAFARSEGLTEVQGFYYARPMTGADVATMLVERATAEAKGTAQVSSAA